MLISVSEALDQVFQHAAIKTAAEFSLSESLGLVLAEDIRSDIDSPPHDKSLVDGYAVRTADLVDGRATLSILEEITAGLVPTKAVTAGNCTRIMTGAPIPAGADAVVMIERSVSVGGYADSSPTQVSLTDPAIHTGQNILPRGKSMRAGEIVLERGAILNPAEIGLLAEVGRTRVPVIPKVRVAVLSTGNELVPADQLPSAGQIRNSNSPLLCACVNHAGATPTDLGIAQDTREDLRRAVSLGLQHDILLISGGVSAGVLDLVPSVLAELGVEQVFHKINLKPGKPLWFGVRRDTSPESSPLVFGLPGNPISTLVCFQLFVQPAIAKMSGRPASNRHETQPARLAAEFTHRGDRPTYYPGLLQSTAEGLLVMPNNWQGSADLRGFVGANCLMAFASGNRRYQTGETVEVLLL
jgi:molybdopterin molybdotransferase